MVEAMDIKQDFQKTEIGEYPIDWNIKELSVILKSTQLGGNYPNSVLNAEYVLIKMGNLGRGFIDLKKIFYIKSGTIPQQIDKSNYGDILFNTRNTLDLVGKVAIWKDELPLAFFNSNIMRLVFKDEEISSNFFMNYILNTPESLHQLRGIATGTTSVAAIYTRDLIKIKVPVPTKAEQTAIATALNDADALITQLEKLIAKKRAIKQGAMQELLKPKEGWEVKKLGKICSRITTGKLDANAMKVDGEYRFYTCAKDFYFIDKYAFDDEALLISGNGENVGYVHYYKGKFNAYQRTYILTGFNQGIQYLKKYLDEYLAARIEVEVNAGNTPYIRMGTLTEMDIYFPKDESEQIRIAQILSDMDTEIEALEKKLDKYKMLKQGMMQNLLNGRIRLV